MEQKHIQAIHLQVSHAFLYVFTQVFFRIAFLDPAIGRRGPFAGCRGCLRTYINSFGPLFQEIPDDTFRFPVAIAGGCINKVNALFKGSFQGFKGVGFRLHTPAATYGPGTKTNFGYLRS